MRTNKSTTLNASYILAWDVSTLRAKDGDDVGRRPILRLQARWNHVLYWKMKPSSCSPQPHTSQPPSKEKALHPRIIMTKTATFSHARLHLPHNRTIMMESSIIDVGKVVQHDSVCKASCCVTSGYYISPTMSISCRTYM
jgi:hypothetical protein